MTPIDGLRLLNIMLHALGLDKPRVRKSYRNHYSTAAEAEKTAAISRALGPSNVIDLRERFAQRASAGVARGSVTEGLGKEKPASAATLTG